MTAAADTRHCHMYIYDARFPLAAKARRQEPHALDPAYREVHGALSLARVVDVQLIAYGKDNRCARSTRRRSSARTREQTNPAEFTDLRTRSTDAGTHFIIARLFF